MNVSKKATGLTIIALVFALSISPMNSKSSLTIIVLGFLLLNSDDVLFLDPSSVAFLYFETEMEDIMETFAPLKFDKRKYIFIPVNDKQDKFQAVGGSHWALLLYVVEGDYFIYFDSTSGIIPSSHDIANKIYAIRHGITDPLDDDAFEIAHYKNTPQQVNSYDCGMYVVALAERLADYLVKEKKTLEDKPEELSEIKPSFISEKRNKIYELIGQLAAKKAAS